MMATTAPMAPVRYRVVDRIQETADTWTLVVEPAGDPGATAGPVRPGQFHMLYAPGVGEVPVSVSAIGDGSLSFTIRAVGSVTRTLDRVPVGAVIGMRGPFGTAWDPEGAEGGDVVVVAGGVGLAPSRPLIRQVLAARDRYRQVSVLIGARTPDDLLFASEVVGWQGRGDVHARVTVDRAGPSWSGPVGVVTTLVDSAPFEPGSTTAFVCGPEAMMRYASRALLQRGMDPGRIRLSTERNMRCAVAHCGHCQLGPVLVCRDGPVMTQRVLGPLMAVRER